MARLGNIANDFRNRKIIDFDFSALYPSTMGTSSSYIKYLKRVRNRQKLYNKLKRKGRKL
jgi:hypothetical protein